MLRIISGAPRSGKTRAILEAIRAGAEGMVYLTPEQNSHAAERALAAFCGPEINLRAEVLSFTRLAGRVFSELGGAADVIPDKGVKLMLMSLAVTSSAEALRVYGSRAMRADFLEALVSAREELAGAKIPPEKLVELGELSEGTVADKLRDLALICSSYDAVLRSRLADPRERLERLAELIPKSGVGRGGVFIDGFTDFTALELGVIEALLRRGGEVTVALCRDGSDKIQFRLADMTRLRLLRLARACACPCAEEACDYADPGRVPALGYFCEALFDYSAPAREPAPGALEALTAGSEYAECELAAAKILRWMKADPTLRFGEIAVCARDYSRYALIAPGVFRLYGLPFYEDKPQEGVKTGIFELALAAAEAVLRSWRRESVFRCIKTGLAGINPDECALLENYCETWNIRSESMWRRAEPWTMNPRGYAGEITERDGAALDKINELRLRVALPLGRLSDRLRKMTGAEELAEALYDYFEALGLPKRFEDDCAALRKAGRSAEADALARLWELMTGALEQFYETLRGCKMQAEEAVRLLSLLLAQLSAGSIPTALDSVSLGELTRLRGRRVRRLIVLGADEGSLPLAARTTGVFSREERSELAELGLELESVKDEELCREFSAIYLAFSAASEGICVMWTASGGASSFPAKRMEKLFGISAQNGEGLRKAAACEASEPLFRLAVSNDPGPEAAAARAMAEEIWNGRLARTVTASETPRGALSPEAVRALYGRSISMTASRTETYSLCRYSYFLRYGLRAKKRAQSDIDAIEFGNFVHYVLENLAREAKARGGFAEISGDCAAIAEKYINEYAEKVLHGLAEKGGRAEYLFSRLKKDVLSIARDVTEELSASDFRPLDFELSFSERGGDLPPVSVPCGDTELRLEGKVDRVDGWESSDGLYLRVADYKTGRKEFSLSDLWYGKSTQMLIYLFALCRTASARYEKKLLPAGVLYAPVRDPVVSLPRTSTDEEIAAARNKLLKRTGLILENEDVIRAMDTSPDMRHIPVTSKNDVYSGSLASPERFAGLEKFVKKLLGETGEGILSGRIEANPLVSPAENPCDWCDYRDACDFRAGRDEARVKRKIPEDEFWNAISAD